MSVFDRMQERYAAGDIPWDDPLPPPEVQELVAKLPAGAAIDLGTGYGRTAIFLAQHGWQVEAIDFIPQAIDIARRRASDQGLDIQFHVADVRHLDFLSPPFDLAVDVGCGHALDEPGLGQYGAELARLLRPGGQFLQFARLRAAISDDDGPRGVPASWLQTALTPYFLLTRQERGVTDMPNGSWESGWFWWLRQGQTENRPVS